MVNFTWYTYWFYFHHTFSKFSKVNMWYFYRQENLHTKKVDGSIRGLNYFCIKETHKIGLSLQTWLEIYLDNSVNVNTRSMWSSLQSTGEVQKGMRLTSVLQKVHTLRALSVLSLSTYADIRFMVKTNHQYRNSHKHAWNVADAYQHLPHGACKLIHIFSFKEKFQSYEPKLINKDPYSIFKESVWTIQKITTAKIMKILTTHRSTQIFLENNPCSASGARECF